MSASTKHKIEINLYEMYEKYKDQDSHVSEILNDWYEGKIREMSCIDKLVQIGVTK